MGRKKNPVTILGETGVTIQTEEFLSEQEKAELFKQRPVDDPVERNELEEFFGNLKGEGDPPEPEPISVNEKACGRCYLLKPIDDYGEDGLRFYCNDCELKFPEEQTEGQKEPEEGTTGADEGMEESEDQSFVAHTERVFGAEFVPPPETKEVPEGEEKTFTEEYPRIEIKTEIQPLKCILTESEMKQAAGKMARANGEWIDSEATLKSVSAQYKAKIASAEAVFSLEASKYRNGYEFRDVEVKVELDHAKGTVEKFRTDTFERLESRRMTTFEAQRKIKFT